MDEDVLSVVRDLRAHAGVTENGAFDVTIDDVVIRVDYTTGSTPSVELSTPYDRARDAVAFAIPAARPLAIVLTLEGEVERSAKARGISRELSTGDAAFDQAIYIDSPSPDRVLSSVFGARALRDACRTLFDDGFVEIRIDDDAGKITARRGQSTTAKLSGVELIRAFAAIARGAPEIEVSGKQSQRLANVIDTAAMVGALAVAGAALLLWGITAWLVLFGALCAMPVVILLARRVMPERFDSLLFPVLVLSAVLGGGIAIWIVEPPIMMSLWSTLGMLIGAGVGWLIGSRLYIRGRSNSHVRRVTSGVLVASIGGLLGAGVALLLAW